MKDKLLRDRSNHPTGSGKSVKEHSLRSRSGQTVQRSLYVLEKTGRNLLELQLEEGGGGFIAVYYKSVLEETRGQWVLDPEAGVSLSAVALGRLRRALEHANGPTS